MYGDRLVKFCYETGFGLWLTEHVLSQSWISRIIGAYYSSAWSREKINPFIREFQIQEDDFIREDYPHFNAFFIRRFKPGKRPFPDDPNLFASGTESRILVFNNVQSDQTLTVKGYSVSLKEMFRNEALAREFEGGSVVVARLCPVDYHRYHFPTSGKIVNFYQIHGALHSVNPIALRAKPDVFLINERHVSVFDTSSFGRMAMIEVGALGVGKMAQTHTSTQFVSGQEKGYFLFGGSTVIWVLAPGKIQWDEDLLENSKKGVETYIRLGDRIGVKKE